MTGRGVAYARKRAKERQAQFSSNFLFIRDDGERARIRFLTGLEDFLQGMFHKPYIDGKGYDPVVCVETDDDPPTIEGMGDVCSLCELERKTDTKHRPGYKYFAWVFVYTILHRNQNPYLEKDANAAKWKPVQLGKGEAAITFYKQEVNKVKLLLFGQPMFDQLLALNVGEEDADEDINILARDFSLVRNGARKDTKTTYTFVPANKETKLSDAVTEAINKLTPLDEAAMAGTVAHYAKASVTADSDEDEAEDIETADEEVEEAEAEVVEDEDFKDL